VGRSPVETEPLVQADKRVGGDDAVLVMGDTAQPKKGKHSVGVAAQYIPALGKNTNCRTIDETRSTTQEWNLSWREILAMGDGNVSPVEPIWMASSFLTGSAASLAAEPVSGTPPISVGPRQDMLAEAKWRHRHRGAARLRQGPSAIEGRARPRPFGVRSWSGFHRHALMTMIAFAFLQRRRLAQARREKAY